MIKFIRNYFKMKAQEIQLKLTIYSYVNNVIDNSREIINTIADLIDKFKDTPIDELQDKVIKALAEIIHTTGNEETEKVDE